jgi:hypothetical protein
MHALVFLDHESIKYGSKIILKYVGFCLHLLFDSL